MSTTSRFAGQVAIVTGAASGLGRSVAIQLALEGARIVVGDVDAAGLEQTEHMLEPRNALIGAVDGDLRDVGTLDRLVSLACDDAGQVDVLCNVAGISPARPLDRVDAQFFDEVMHVNCWAPMNLIRLVAPEMRRLGRGSIVNVSSVGGLVALPHLSVYSASKAAVIGMTKGLAQELSADGIRCNAICPGGMDTSMAKRVVESFENREEALAGLTGRQLFKRFADPEEVARVVVFVASDEASFMTGAIVSVDAGHTSW